MIATSGNYALDYCLFQTAEKLKYSQMFLNHLNKSSAHGIWILEESRRAIETSRALLQSQDSTPIRGLLSVSLFTTVADDFTRIEVFEDDSIYSM